MVDFQFDTEMHTTTTATRQIKISKRNGNGQKKNIQNAQTQICNNVLAK